MKNDESYILFQLAGATYGIPSLAVLHIEMVEHITAVPNAHQAIDGVVFSRGRLVPVLNLRTRFGFPRETPHAQTRIIVALANGRSVGLMVDSAREFKNIPRESLRPISESLTGLATNYLKGLVTADDRLILLLDLDAALDLDREPSLAAALANVGEAQTNQIAPAITN